MDSEDEKLALIVSAKESYRATSRAMTWEEKIASVERMRDAAKKAREAMQETLRREAEGKSPNT